MPNVNIYIFLFYSLRKGSYLKFFYTSEQHNTSKELAFQRYAEYLFNFTDVRKEFVQFFFSSNFPFGFFVFTCPRRKSEFFFVRIKISWKQYFPFSSFFGQGKFIYIYSSRTPQRNSISFSVLLFFHFDIIKQI